MWTDGRTYGRTFFSPSNIIRSTFGSGPKKWPNAIHCVNWLHIVFSLLILSLNPACTFEPSWKLPVSSPSPHPLPATFNRQCRWWIDGSINRYDSNMPIFPVGPGLACTRMSPFRILLVLKMMKVVVTNWSYKTCKAPVKSSQPTNQHPTFYRPDVLPVTEPTASEHWIEKM